MDIPLTRSDSVYSKDGNLLGSPFFIAHRLEDDENTNPELRYYPAYVRIISRSLGTNFHVPTKFFTNRDDGDHTVTLSISQHEVLDHWMRLPKFVARGLYRRENLPEN